VDVLSPDAAGAELLPFRGRGCVGRDHVDRSVPVKVAWVGLPLQGPGTAERHWRSEAAVTEATFDAERASVPRTGSRGYDEQVQLIVTVSVHQQNLAATSKALAEALGRAVGRRPSRCWRKRNRRPTEDVHAPVAGEVSYVAHRTFGHAGLRE